MQRSKGRAPPRERRNHREAQKIEIESCAMKGREPIREPVSPKRHHMNGFDMHANRRSGFKEGFESALKLEL